MNRVVMLSEIKKEKEESNLSTNINDEYCDFKNKFFKNYLDKKNCNKDNLNSSNVDILNRLINKIFTLNNKKPFIDFINKIFDDYLGTNCELNCIYDDRNIEIPEKLILKNSSCNIKILARDDYRSFEYNIQLQTDDCENLSISILKNKLDRKDTNIINFKQKKRQYSINNSEKKEKLYSNSDLYLIIMNSNIRIPDSYEIMNEYNDNGYCTLYKFNILKGWKYNFKDLYENNLYLLYPLKVLDLKKGITYMKNSGFSDEIIEKEKVIFFNKMNKYLNMLKEKNIVSDVDIYEFNSISKQMLEAICN